MSVQLEALADEVFGAAAAQGRAGAQSRREPFGEVVWNPSYPDLFFLNGIIDVVAPTWRANDVERVLREAMPDIRSFRAYVRDPKTIATLGASLTASGYHHEIRVAMVQSFAPHPDTPPQGRRGNRAGRAGEFAMLSVDNDKRWAAFEESVRTDTTEHEWTTAMTEQLVALYRWRAANTPTKFFVAIDGELPAGHVALFQHGATAYLHALFTRSGLRRHGVGSALTLAMHDEMRAMGAERLTLQCTDDGYLPNFYHRLGFRRVGEQQIWSKL